MIAMIRFVLGILATACIVGGFSLTPFLDKYRDEYPDAVREVPAMVVEHGYPLETHTAVTDDGYILTLHRIPQGLVQRKSLLPLKRPVAFVQHGLLCSSADWVVMGPDKGLAYILADAGYDVWMGNARGTTYSMSHVNLTSSDTKFWDFSWHEMGVYDVPTMIDYVLQQTGQSKVHYIGHSMGTTMFYVMTSMKPEYNRKIKAMFSLAPVAFVGNVRTALFRPPILEIEDFLLHTLSLHQILPHDSTSVDWALRMCRDHTLTQQGCIDFLFGIGGPDKGQLNTTALPNIFAHFPAGTGRYVMIHYNQDIESSKFRQFDHGLVPNLMKYGQATPPNYDLSKISAPVILQYGANDYLGDPKDVLILNGKLPNVKKLIEVDWPKFNHFDFLWGKDVKKLVYDTTLSLMQQYNS